MCGHTQRQKKTCQERSWGDDLPTVSSELDGRSRVDKPKLLNAWLLRTLTPDNEIYFEWSQYRNVGGHLLVPTWNHPISNKDGWKESQWYVHNFCAETLSLCKGCPTKTRFIPISNFWCFYIQRLHLSLVRHIIHDDDLGMVDTVLSYVLTFGLRTCRWRSKMKRLGIHRIVSYWRFDFLLPLTLVTRR